MLLEILRPKEEGKYAEKSPVSPLSEALDSFLPSFSFPSTGTATEAPRIAF